MLTYYWLTFEIILLTCPAENSFLHITVLILKYI